MTTWLRAADWRNWTLAELGSRSDVLRFGLAHDFEALTGITALTGTNPRRVIADSSVLLCTGKDDDTYFTIDMFDNSADGEFHTFVHQMPNGNSAGGITGFVFRSTDGTNYYIAILNGVAATLEVYKRVAGAYTLLGSIASGAVYAEPGYSVETSLSLSGTSIIFKDITNNLTVNVTDATYSTGNIGLLVSSISANSRPGAIFNWFYLVSTATSGTATSPSVDFGSANQRGLLVWDEDLADGGDVTFDIQSSSDNGVADAWANVTGLTGLTDPAGKVFTLPERYGRVVANFSRSTTSQDLKLKAVTFGTTSVALNGAGRGVMRGM